MRPPRLRFLTQGILAAVASLSPLASYGQAVPPVAVPSASPKAGDQDDPDRAAYPIRMDVKVGEGSILIKAPNGVRKAALTKAREKLWAILANTDPDVVRRMGNSGLVIILAPHMGKFTDIPDLHDLANVRNAFDQPLDLARGIFRMPDPPLRDASEKPRRPTRDFPIVVVGEEDILRLIPCGPQSALHHEFAHAIHRLGLTQEQRVEWKEKYTAGTRAGLFKGRYASLSPDEYFAELSEAYFDVSPYFCSREQLARVAPKTYLFLANVYSSRALKSEVKK